MLMTGRGPMHVFGDVLKQRIDKSVRISLKRTHDWAKNFFEREVKRKGRSAEEAKHASLKAGTEMLKRMQGIMKHVTFNMDHVAWCYKCKKYCPVHANHLVDREVDEAITVAVAGTTCTSWSSMGKKGKWIAASAMPFMVWAYETLAAEPDIVIHECTPRFDFGMLVAIFGFLYVVQSFCFSPTDLGWPASRPRRWTLMYHRKRRNPIVPLSRPNFGAFFFRASTTDGHIFWDAPKEDVDRFIKDTRKRMLPEADSDGQGWSPRDALPEGHYQRLLAYERSAKRHRKAPVFIINLHQSCAFMNTMTRIVPTLLTRTSTIWSMIHNRQLIPKEMMQVMGLCPYEEPGQLKLLPGIEQLAIEGKVADKDITHACGNGMTQISVGSMLLFALGSYGCYSEEIPLPIRDADAEGEEDEPQI